MTTSRRYTLSSVVDDIKDFFLDDTHWAHQQYGSQPTHCDTDSVFYKKQLEVIFEDKYPHDITGKAISELITNGFLRPEPRSYGDGMNTIFVWKRSLRYKSMEIRERLRLMEILSDDELNDGAGKHAEDLFGHMFEKNQFKIIGRNTNEYRRKKWRRSNKNLDFIIEKDGVSYGVEIRNRFDYMRQAEFEEKLDMCGFLGLLPLFPLRCPSEQQFASMFDVGGLALKFKVRIFPPGNQKLVTNIWNYFRLPVNVWHSIPENIEGIFSYYHKQNLR